MANGKTVSNRLEKTNLSKSQKLEFELEKSSNNSSDLNGSNKDGIKDVVKIRLPSLNFFR